MPSNDYGSLEKLLNPSSGPAHSSIKDGNLQIQIPHTFEITDLDRMNRFKAVHTRLERGPLTHTAEHERDMELCANPVSAMEDAQNTYETMMEIRKQLDQAYQEFLRMQ